MSWYSGSQLTHTSLAVSAAASPQARMLASRLPWLSATPLGSPVEPEVYWISARLPGPGAGGSAAGGRGPSSRLSGVTTWASAGERPASMRASGRTRLKVINTRASQLRRMPA